MTATRGTVALSQVGIDIRHAIHAAHADAQANEAHAPATARIGPMKFQREGSSPHAQMMLAPAFAPPDSGSR